MNQLNPLYERNESEYLVPTNQDEDELLDTTNDGEFYFMLHKLI